MLTRGLEASINECYHVVCAADIIENDHTLPTGHHEQYKTVSLTDVTWPVVFYILLLFSLRWENMECKKPIRGEEEKRSEAK
jgi:hypothetical protein